MTLLSKLVPYIFLAVGLVFAYVAYHTRARIKDEPDQLEQSAQKRFVIVYISFSVLSFLIGLLLIFLPM